MRRILKIERNINIAIKTYLLLYSTEQEKRNGTEICETHAFLVFYLF